MGTHKVEVYFRSKKGNNHLWELRNMKADGIEMFSQRKVEIEYTEGLYCEVSIDLKCTRKDSKREIILQADQNSFDTSESENITFLLINRVNDTDKSKKYKKGKLSYYDLTITFYSKTSNINHSETIKLIALNDKNKEKRV